MVRLALRELVGRRIATGLALAGLCTACLGFAVMTGGAQYTQARLTGDLSRAWNAQYDLLVRPSYAIGTTEEELGLMPQNFSTGLSGGISYAQLAAIRSLAGVQVAAPLVVVGSVNWDLGSFTVPLGKSDSSVMAYRITYKEQIDAGLATYGMDDHIALVAHDGSVNFPARSRTPTLTTGGRTIECAYPVFCWAPTFCDSGVCQPYPDPPSDGIEIWQPVPIAGVDPVAEAQLVGLDKCLQSGRYLTAADVPQRGQDQPGTNIPVLVSTRSFVDTNFTADVSAWKPPPPLAAPSLGPNAPGATKLTPVTVSANDLYRQHLPAVANDTDFWPIWRVGHAAYQAGRDRRLAPIPIPADLSVYGHPNFTLLGGSPDELRIPPESKAGWYRAVTASYYSRDAGDRDWQVVGIYEPSCLPGFDALSRAGMETYAAPQVTLSDGRVLGPDRSVGGYIASPPLILTNLAGADWLMDSTRFIGQNSQAPISSIRIRVRSLPQKLELAQRRLEQVALAIREKTGLNVDLVRGSSPQSVSLKLPLGGTDYGTAELWTKKGVVIQFDRAVTGQTIAFLALAAGLGAVLTTQTGFTAVRRRRRELAMLRALGWSSFDSFRLVLLELGILGALATVASVAALLVARAFAPQMPLYMLAAPAIGVVAGLGGGLIPAALAARARPAEAISHAQWAGRNRRLNSKLVLGALELWRAFRIEVVVSAILIGAGSVAVGAVVAAGSSFVQHLDGSWLGVYIGGQVRPFHAILAVTAACVATLAAAQLATLAYLERGQTLAALRAMGWSKLDVFKFIIGGGLLIMLPAVLMAAAILAGAALAAGAPQSAVELPLELAVGTGLISGFIAIACPAILALVARPATLLRGE